MDGFEIIDPIFKTYVLGNAPLEKLGEASVLEGPVWFGDMGMLIFSDLPNNRVMRWSESDGVRVFRAPSHFANGHARDRQGRLITCSHQARRITRLDHDGTEAILADRFHGKRLNAPNDIVVKSDGTIWFTDPLYGLQTDYEGGRQAAELPPAVFVSIRTMAPCASSPTNSTARTACASRRTSARSILPRAASSRRGAGAADLCFRRRR